MNDINLSNIINIILITAITVLAVGFIIVFTGKKTIKVDEIITYSCNESDYKKLNLVSRFIKRSIDIAFSLLAIIVLLPMWIFIAILIKSEDHGIVFFKARHYGYRNKPIDVYKFRTMRMSIDAFDTKTLQKQEYDPRITRIGRFLRLTSLDELPLLFSVLKGDLTLVGLRKNPYGYPLHQNQYYYEKPGVVSLYAIVYHYRLNKSEFMSTYEYNCSDYYLANHSLILDVKIFLATVASLFS